MNKKIMAGAAALVLAGAISPTAFAAENVGVTTQMPSGEEVVNYWKNYQSKSQDKMDYKGAQLTNSGRQLDDANTYAESPKEDGSYEGKLTDEVKQDTLHVINTYRYMAGLNEVVENKELSDKAQSGAYIGYLNDGISHYPETPEKLTDERIINDGKLATSESNIAIGYNIIYESMQAYMDDEDDSNKEALGHRRWLLNAHAKEVGIGQVGTSNATYVASDNNLVYESGDVVPYPANNTLAEMIHSDAPFSVQFGSNFAIQSADGITVTVKNTKTGETKTYTAGNGLVYNGNSYGNNTSLIFGAELSKEAGTQYRVSISGVKLNGADYPVAYDVNFISTSGNTTITPSEEDKPSDEGETDKPVEEETPSDDNTNEDKPKEEVSDSATVEYENPHDGKLSITTSNVIIGKANEEGVRKIEKVDKVVKDAEGNEVPNYSVMYFIDNVGEVDEDGMADVDLSVIYGDALAGKIKIRAKVLGAEQEKPDKPSDNEKPDDEDKPSDDKEKPSDDKKEENKKPESLTDKPFDTREEAEKAAQKALKNDPINKSYKVSQGKDGKFYVQLSPVEEKQEDDKKEDKKNDNNKTVTVKPKKTESKKVEKKEDKKDKTSDEKVKTGITGAGIVGGALAAALVGYKATKKRD